MPDPTFHITTPRLHLSYLDPSNDSHMTYVVELQNSPNILAMAAQTGSSVPPPFQTPAEARQAISLTHPLSRIQTTGLGRYIISLRTEHDIFDDSPTQEYIGHVSMQFQRYPNVACPRIPDLGFGLLDRYCGLGYASEACEALLQHLKETRGWDRFAGFTHPANGESRKLFTRLGFVSRGTVGVVGVVGDRAPVDVAVWVRGVDEGVGLAELGIGAGDGVGGVETET